MVMVFGEITTNAKIDYEQVVRDAVKEIGYDDPAKVRVVELYNILSSALLQLSSPLYLTILNYVFQSLCFNLL